MPFRFAAAALAAATLLSIAPAPAAAAPSLQHLIGQKLVVSMDGHTPSASLLERARRGRIGGVLIHSWNFSSAAQLESITAKLQQAAAEGGQPPLLIAVDQEGGLVRRLRWAAPTMSAAQMGASAHPAATARKQVAIDGIGGDAGDDQGKDQASPEQGGVHARAHGARDGEHDRVIDDFHYGNGGGVGCQGKADGAAP